MKQLLISLATIVLTTSSIANISLWTKQTHRQQPIVNQPKRSNQQATQEDAEDIANKLWNQVVKIDPNFWLNKDIQTDQADFKKALVQQGLLTQTEAQYVTWNSLNINEAGYFWNKGAFTVQKDGASATGHVTVDADTGETTAQIAAKIQAASNLQFNFNYWNTKAIQDSLPELRNILVNDHILTKVEASVVAGVDPITVTQVGQINLHVNVNDQNTNSYANTKVNVVNDGDSATQIANNINNLELGLKVNTAGMYADSNYVIKNFANLLVGNYGLSPTDADYITLPHVLLKDENPNMSATIAKDGQITKATVDLKCDSGPYIYYYKQQAERLQAYVNLNPGFLSYLQGYFPSHNNKHILSYFYSMLDDNQDDSLVNYPGPYMIPWANRLDQNISKFGDDPSSDILGDLTDTSQTTNNEFADQLKSAVMNANGFLSVMFDWTFTDRSFKSDTYYMQSWKFW